MTARQPLTEKTNSLAQPGDEKKRPSESEKQRIVTFLMMAMAETKDHSLRYDIDQCIEIIEGKENRQVAELKSMFEELVQENRGLSERCDKLKVENLFLKKDPQEKENIEGNSIEEE